MFLVFPIDFLLSPSLVCYSEPALLTCAGWMVVFQKGDVAPRGYVTVCPASAGLLGSSWQVK